METISIIVTLISVIASIMQIMLFFKVWEMCNDIKAMRKSTIKEEQSTIAKKDEADNSLSWLILIAVGVVVVISIMCFAK
jgi:hypothetical protein